MKALSLRLQWLSPLLFAICCACVCSTAGAAIPFGGNIGGVLTGVNYGSRHVDIRATNGIVYHVNLDNAQVLINGRQSSIDSVTRGEWARVYASGVDERRFEIIANEIRISTNGENGGQNSPPGVYGHGSYSRPSINNGSLHGSPTNIDYGAARFGLATTAGTYFTVNASKARVTINGQRASFGDLSPNQTVQVFYNRVSNQTIWATEIRATQGSIDNGGYSSGGNTGWNNGQSGRPPGWNHGKKNGWKGHGEPPGQRKKHHGKHSDDQGDDQNKD